MQAFEEKVHLIGPQQKIEKWRETCKGRFLKFLIKSCNHWRSILVTSHDANDSKMASFVNKCMIMNPNISDEISDPFSTEVKLLQEKKKVFET